MRKSRLGTAIEKRTKKSLFLFLLGTILIIVLGLKYGIPLLADMALFVARPGGKEPVTNNSSEPEFIAPPVLNELTNATKSAEITVSGTSQKDRKIIVYLNDTQKLETTTDTKGNFILPNVKLQEGNNTIKARAQNSKGIESSLSNTISILYLLKKPTLVLISPQDNQTFKTNDNPITISGKTDPKTRVTVNGFWAIMKDDGSFSYLLTLQKGDNNIQVVSKDEAGNETILTRKVTLSQ